MKFDLQRFYQACNPSKTLVFGNAEDAQYYIDFASVRGGKTIAELGRTIARLSPDEPTCQLFTGHIGCGKSTELLRLKADLEAQGFEAIYFESSQDLEMADVDICDILLAIARQVSETLEEQGIVLSAPYCRKLLVEAGMTLHLGMNWGEIAGLGEAIARLTTHAKESPKVRAQLRQYLEPRTSRILDAINNEILLPGTEQLKARGKQGLVAIVDNLDRVDNRTLASGRSQPEYLFVDRGEQLRKLKCHLVYTIPLSLMFSHDCEALKSRLGAGVAPKVLPMVPVRLKTGEDCREGMDLLREAIVVRAFPEVPSSERLELVGELFERPESLDRLCRISGGHIRNLLGLVYRCLQQEDPPFAAEAVETAIQERRDDLILALSTSDWQRLREVAQTKNIRGEARDQLLLRSMFVFEYRDARAGRWFDINPMLAETKALLDDPSTIPAV